MLILFYSLIFLFQHYLFFVNSNILQKQYYELNRYILYIKENKAYIFKVIVLLLTILLIFVNRHFCFLFLLFFIDKHNNKIIKFKITNRIKRLFITFEIINLLFFVLFILYQKYLLINIIISIFIYWIAFVFASIIEQIILHKYIKNAQKKLKSYKTKIIAITGSYGKTSCKNFIYDLIKNDYKVLYSQNSYNTLNGLLLTINYHLRPYHEIVILEIGVDRKNGMNKFIKNFSFDIGLITCIGNQHLKTFKNINNIASEKIKLLYNCNDTVVINNEDDFLKDLSFKCSKITASTNVHSNIILNKMNDKELNLMINNNYYIVNWNLLGKHNLQNLALSIGVAKALKIDDDVIISSIKKIKNVNHRLSIIKQKNITIIDDSYNSNYNGFINALDELKKYNTFRILITPGIIETNKDLLEKTTELIEKINECCNLVLLTYNNVLLTKTKHHLVFNSFAEAYDYVKRKYADIEITILIENDLPDIFLR